MNRNSYEIDMCNGSLFKKIAIFSYPLILSGILQLLFNAADIVVVGRYTGKEALAAVGSTASLINLLTNVFIGLSIGANVVVARFRGAGHDKDVSETVHTSLIVSVVSGVILTIIGTTFSKQLLELMSTPPDVIDQAALYVRIYFLGMPVVLLYNFGSSILRAIGDTKRPLIFLSIAGVVNVILNLLFVITFDMGVAGVALATIISQSISAVLVVLCLMKTDGPCRLYLNKLRVNKRKLIMIAQIGLPAGIQGSIFSISNVMIQSSINSFGSVAMAGNTAASNIEGFIYVTMNSLHQAAISFTSQNYGAGNYKRIPKILGICLAITSVMGFALGVAAYLNGEFLINLYSPEEPEVVVYGLLRMRMICFLYFTCGTMEIFVGVIRGIGYSIMPMITSLMGACVMRIVWIYTVFEYDRTLRTLYISYPISWILTTLAHAICFCVVWRKLKRRHSDYFINKSP